MLGKQQQRFSLRTLEDDGDKHACARVRVRYDTMALPQQRVRPLLAQKY